MAEPNYLDLGIFKDTLLPSLAFHGIAAVDAWAIGALTNRLEAKDWLWPSAQVANVWWTAVGRHVWAGKSASGVLKSLSRPEWLILVGVSAWGVRLFARTVARTLARGEDDPRYTEVKKQPNFWPKSLITVFAPEAIFQAFITLPFAIPFRHVGGITVGYHPWLQAVSVGILSAGLALETFADWQLDEHKAKGESGLLREGVWSIVRHPNYLGDSLVQISFPILLYASDMFTPLELLGPIANYIYLRYWGGVPETESHQTRRYSIEDPEKMEQLKKYREEKHAFWPDANELSNTWAWIILGCGAAGIALEQALLTIFEY